MSQQRPLFDYGDEVRVIKNIRNDGTLQGGRGQLLVRRGTTGFIRQAGYFQQDQIVYQVHFLDSNQLVGCRESELATASEDWIYNEFEYGDKAQLTLALSVAGERIANRGDTVSVLAVDRSKQQIHYRIQLIEHDIDVPARALTAVSPPSLPESNNA
ncbi:nitrogen fixation protein NifZ [Reinekea thalattae]|uniref:Nitrogen fixation protein NifZ n=1 Tax=Reinekea thalattae TaxID=2593301 RepID=A0A5C8Z727_9GAMM|nr:nitrogen fixation protein NifZ [Reinekea thalattae]TXR53038.1 nitrogen fixation protein NifZ [Reinekea thalattae]